MSSVRRSIKVGAPPAQAEAVWLDQARWPVWIDGLRAVLERRGQWPQVGASVLWDSTPHGRGRVDERVSEYRPGARLALTVADERLQGTQTVTFDPVEGGAQVTLELVYALRRAGPVDRMVDILFIRRALGDSLGRTLQAFARQL